MVKKDTQEMLQHLPIQEKLESVGKSLKGLAMEGIFFERMNVSLMWETL